MHYNDCKHEPIFLFFGYASEYTLNPLYRYMKEKGDNCVEIDMFTCQDTKQELINLIGKEIIFITSAHFLLDETNFTYHYPHKNKVISPLHVISTLKPVASIYYPHDLMEPVKEEEIPYLPLFDHFLSPLAELDVYNKFIPLTQVGWIKHFKQDDSLLPECFNPSKSVFFAAYQVHVNRGLDYFYEQYKPMFDAGIAVKFAHWNGSEQFESYLRDKGVCVYPSKTLSTQIMETNDLIFTQALSSTVLEASRLGKKVVYIKNSELDHKEPETLLAREKNIVYINSATEAASIKSENIPNSAKTMHYFDFEKARNAIWSTYK